MQNSELVLRTEIRIAAPLESVFDFFADAGNLERITPPALKFRILTPAPVVMRAGTRIDYQLSLYGFPFRWQTEITEWQPPHAFVDTQLKGPYAQWIHRHTFRAEEGGTRIGDEVRYRLPFPLLGELARPIVRIQLHRIFRYRANRLRGLFDCSAPADLARAIPPHPRYVKP